MVPITLMGPSSLSRAAGGSELAPEATAQWRGDNSRGWFYRCFSSLVSTFFLNLGWFISSIYIVNNIFLRIYIGSFVNGLLNDFCKPNIQGSTRPWTVNVILNRQGLRWKYYSSLIEIFFLLFISSSYSII
jgi:hypothetical protein